ncbi:MAG: HupE/UreJ family protein [Bacteroidetes bacterium]|nr:HupE/UreJ family protein [Bacteroidota bacterium]
MSDFYLWFSTGMEHIADWQGYDHILFLVALSAVYNFKDWKKLLILVTAFTVGHSITLALSVLDIVRIPSPIIEFLIPMTIVATCIYNLFNLNLKEHKGFQVNYFMALVFGFVHGLGFSYLLKSLLGKEESIVYPLFAFNLGLETGQVLILAGVLIISLILSAFTKVKQRDQKMFLSSAVFGIALLMALERFFDLF